MSLAARCRTGVGLVLVILAIARARESRPHRLPPRRLDGAISCPAHVSASAEPGRLVKVVEALREVRAGSVSGIEQSGNRVVFAFDGFKILVGKPLLEGRKGDKSRGGSGLTTWQSQ